MMTPLNIIFNGVADKHQRSAQIVQPQEGDDYELVFEKRYSNSRSRRVG